MVSVSSTLPSMDLKKLAFSEQMLTSPRRKVVSRFGVGIVLSFTVLSVVLFNFSSKGSFINPVFQELYNFGSVSSSSSRSWPFSSGFASFPNTTGNKCNDTSTVGKSSVNETLEKNVEGKSKSSDFVDFNWKDEILDSGRLDNVSVKAKDAGFLVGEGSHGMNRDGRNVSQIDNAKILGNGSGNVSDLESTRVRVPAENVKNESVRFEEDGYSGGNFSSVFVESMNNSNSRQEIEAYHALSRGGMKGTGVSYSSYEDCDIFDGEWVRDDTKPHYPPGSCPYIDRDFDCHLNGRPDSEYVKWRWQPQNCDIPRFNGTDFLERIRGQKLVFVGDSLNRNMWESLVCLLRHGVADKKKVYEISGRHEFKKKGFYAFRFEDYNCSVDFVSSPFLVKESSFHGKNGSFETLRLDLMDGTTSMYYDADVLIFNTGHWWTHEKTSRGEDYYQEGNYVHPRLKVMKAFKMALSTWGKWVDNNVDGSKSQIIFRGYSVTHFRGGPWNSGGQCHKETEPIFNVTHLDKYPTKMKALEYVLKGMKTPVSYLNISRLTDYRKDGHPSIYRPDYQTAQREVHAQDCSHWCLPGVPDTWNELLYVSLLKSGRGTWRH